MQILIYSKFQNTQKQNFFQNENFKLKIIHRKKIPHYKKITNYYESFAYSYAEI